MNSMIENTHTQQKLIDFHQRILLKHPSLVADKNPPPQSMLSSSFPEINVESDLAGSVLDKLLRERGKSEGAKKAAEKRKLTSEMIAENIFKSQRLTTGVMTKNAIHSLNNPRFLEPFCLRCIETAKKERREDIRAEGTH
jgi:hypothetical protein